MTNDDFTAAAAAVVIHVDSASVVLQLQANTVGTLTDVVTEVLATITKGSSDYASASLWFRSDIFYKNCCPYHAGYLLTATFVFYFKSDAGNHRQSWFWRFRGSDSK